MKAQATKLMILRMLYYQLFVYLPSSRRQPFSVVKIRYLPQLKEAGRDRVLRPSTNAKLFA
jgi:hypothetical protein